MAETRGEDGRSQILCNDIPHVHARYAARALVGWCVCLVVSGLAPAFAAIPPQGVLVVYNSRSTEAVSVVLAYRLAHLDIPESNFFDLNDTTIANTATISYDTFVQRIRNPIRAYIDLPGDPSVTSIVSLCLIRGLPHRIQDSDVANAGDDPSVTITELEHGDMTAASVDSELVLLWQDLHTGEAGGTMDSKADNLIDNPYHTLSASIDTYSRDNIKVAKTLLNTSNVVWRVTGTGASQLTPGDMVLVSRIDGNSTADAIALINRSQGIVVNRRYASIILDEDARIQQLDDDDILGSPTVFNAGPDYENTRDHMRAAGWPVWYDATTLFIDATLQPRPVVLYASYGENHSPNPPGNGTYINGFHFAPGAIFNTAESYNGRALNGLGTLFAQEQVADFITAGGTFGIGMVWEPLSYSLPDNDFLTKNLLVNNMTWGEAAWSAIPALSWMQVVIGDPLAQVTVVDQPADFDTDGDVDLEDLVYLESCTTGPALGPLANSCTDADLDHDGDVDQADFGIFQHCQTAISPTGKPSCAD